MSKCPVCLHYANHGERSDCAERETCRVAKATEPKRRRWWRL